MQWQFYQLTGSILVFGQGVLQLAVTVFLLAICLKADRQWQLVVQFFNSFIILLLCGLLLSESYIRWYEGVAIVTAEAIPVVGLGFVGLWLMSRLIVLMANQGFTPLEHRMAGFVFPWLSATLSIVLLITHFTGWFWLDNLTAGLVACLVGLGAIFFLVDGYWHIMESREDV